MGTVAVIGAGAAGLMAALQAARTGAEVILLEARDRVGKSILATGNGRCNFSNVNPEQGQYRHNNFVQQLFATHEQWYRAECLGPAQDLVGPHAVCDFFFRLGLAWREEWGRLYPLTNKASTIVDLLRSALAAQGVREYCERRVVSVGIQDMQDKARGDVQDGAHEFALSCNTGEIFRADVVILASGGHSAQPFECDVSSGGAPTVRATQAALCDVFSNSTKFSAVLGPLVTDVSPIKGLNNIRVQGALELRRPGQTMPLAYEQGEILFRDYGVSGIAVFNLSRFAQPKDILSIDFLPALSQEELVEYLGVRWRSQLNTYGETNWHPSAIDMLNGLLLPAVARRVVQAAGFEAQAPFAAEQIPALAAVLKNFSLQVRSVGDMRQCQVMRGGLSVADFSPTTLEAREVAGLFAAGEALDVDAACGGFNLHWAWTSGMLAGARAARVCATGSAAFAFETSFSKD